MRYIVAIVAFMVSFAAFGQPAGFTKIKSAAGAEYVYPVRLLLPKDSALSLNRGEELSESSKLILDPRYGAFYRFTRVEKGIVSIVEGLLDPTQTAEQCAAIGSREVFYGTNEPRDRDGLSNLEGDAPSREITFAIGCAKYSIKMQCLREALPNACRQVLQNLQKTRGWRSMLLLATTVRNDEFNGASARPMPLGKSGAVETPPTKESFSFLEPGIFRVRQYLEPSGCDEIARAQYFFSDGRTEYSRVVFAGPNVLKRFPVDLSASDKAVPNSQIFGPGGNFFISRSNAARLLEQGVPIDRPKSPRFATFVDDVRADYETRCHRKLELEKNKAGGLLLGEPGDPTSIGTTSNFLYPWSDTFCEFRGNRGAYLMCGAKGRLISSIHYGVDIRGQAQDLSIKTPVISAADGKVLEEDLIEPTCRDKHADDCKANPASKYWDIGHTVKIKALEDPRVTFVYRHMNPELSPFSHLNGKQLKPGDTVQAGQIIGYMHGYMSKILNGTPKHLHFEIEFSASQNLLSQCTRKREGKTVQLCANPTKAPPYPSLLVAYLREKYNFNVTFSEKEKDATLGLFRLPTLNNEITAKELSDTGQAFGKLAPFVAP